MRNPDHIISVDLPGPLVFPTILLEIGDELAIMLGNKTRLPLVLAAFEKIVSTL
jgi:hypothetical protein